MLWKKCSHELPYDGEEVLVKHTIIYLAVFHAEDGVFLMKDGSTYSKEIIGLEWARLGVK